MTVDLSTANAIEAFDLLVTAEEAFAAFEDAVLAAEHSVVGCFRVFDLRTKLRGASARKIGDTWFDLILHALNRGVAFSLTVTDFDPIIATEDHRRSWSSARQFAAVNELSTDARFTWTIADHPARVGLIPRVALQAKSRPEMNATAEDPLTPGLADRKSRMDLPLIPATHHQKLAVIDNRSLYIGGLDLNERRYDTKDHALPAEQTWHDIQAVVEGPVVAAALRHLDSFQAVTAGQRPATASAPGFLRTLSMKRSAEVLHFGPKDHVAEIEKAHLDAIAETVGPIYFETQFFRHKPLAEALAKAARTKPQLTCTMVLPASPEDVAFEGNRREDAQFGAQLQMECIDIVAEAFGNRLSLASPARPAVAPTDSSRYSTLFDAPIVYVHSKVSLFGAQQAIVSSANLNGRSLRWDTEAGVHLVDPDHVQTLWHRVLSHWLGRHPIDPLEDQTTFIHWLNGALAQNIATPPEERSHFLLPYPRGRDIELASPLPGVPDEMV
ncbi:phospholipase D family protein [Gymnodinialimonas ulvae]|uniref:phospholipase D family protein n=1 Tax=Gymnodinialimonas ulvae TaxID=3126504 RepID=UPI0030991B34